MVYVYHRRIHALLNTASPALIRLGFRMDPHVSHARFLGINDTSTLVDKKIFDEKVDFNQTTKVGRVR